MTRALDLLGEFPAPTVAGAVLLDGAVVDHEGPLEHRFRLASIAKTITAWVILIAVEEGTVSLDDEVGPPPATGVRTVRHLLAHAGGYGFDGPVPIVSPERNRIYSNTGIEVAADHVAAAAGMPFEEYLRLGPRQPVRDGLRSPPQRPPRRRPRFPGRRARPDLHLIRRTGGIRQRPGA